MYKMLQAEISLLLYYEFSAKDTRTRFCFIILHPLLWTINEKHYEIVLFYFINVQHFFGPPPVCFIPISIVEKNTKYCITENPNYSTPYQILVDEMMMIIMYIAVTTTIL